MRQFFKGSLFFKNNKILLYHNSIGLGFTFLQGDLYNLDRIEGKENLVQSPFISQFKKYKQNLIQIRQIDFKQDNLNFDNEKLSQYGLFNQNRRTWLQNQYIIKKLSLNYSLMEQQILQKITVDNLDHYLQILGTFNCLNIRLWQKIYSIISSTYKEKNINRREYWGIVCQQYTTKFGKIGKTKSKFIIPQTYLNDLTQFRTFFKKVQFQNDYIMPKDSRQIAQKKLQILQKKIVLITKVSKSADLDIYFLKDIFQKRESQILGILKNYNSSNLHQWMLINVYHLYSYINYENQQFYDKIQTYLNQYFIKIFKQKQTITHKNQQDQNKQQYQHNLYLIINKVLGVWKFNQRPNIKIYQQFLKPELQQMVQKKVNTRNYQLMGTNLLMSGIKDMNLIKKLLDNSYIYKKQQQTSEAHILKHYMNIHLGQNLYKTGIYCKNHQHQFVLNYIKQNFSRQAVYSECWDLNIGQSTWKKNQQTQQAEQFWFQIFDELFQKQKTLKNYNFCVYQIDFMVFLQNKLIAIQIVGGHYTKKRYNQNQKNDYNNIKSTGKKRIRQQIITHYGVNFIKIHCQMSQCKLIVQAKNIALGKKFILQKVNQIIPNWQPFYLRQKKTLFNKKIPQSQLQLQK